MAKDGDTRSPSNLADWIAPTRPATFACASFAAARAQTSASIGAYSSSTYTYSSRNSGSSIKRFFNGLSFVMTPAASSLAVASARRGVLHNFIAKTRRTNARRPAAVTQIPLAIPFGPDPNLPDLVFEMPGMEGAKRFQTNILHRLQQPNQPCAQRHRQSLDFGVDGRDGFDRPTHAHNSVPRLQTPSRE